VNGRALAIGLFVLLVFVLPLAGWQQSAPSDAPQGSAAASPNSTVAPQDSGSAKRNKKHKKNDADATVFDERAAAAVLGTVRDGLEGHSQRLLLSAFDGEKMGGFLSFEDQIEAYFTRYESKPRRRIIAESSSPTSRWRTNRVAEVASHAAKVSCALNSSAGQRAGRS